jgi:hypothetical protein
MRTKRNLSNREGQPTMYDMLQKFAAGGKIYADGGIDGDPEKETAKEKAYRLMKGLQEKNRDVEAQGDVGHGGFGGTSTDVMVSGRGALESLLQERPERMQPIEPIGPTVIKNDRPRPTLGGGSDQRTEEEETPTDFGGLKGGLEFRPMFGGNISQTGFRGPGTTGALTGAFADVRNPDGTMDRVKTQLSDMPEYITKDPYFTRLLDTANKKYFNLERAKGSIGGAEAAKTPEAKLIARILNGDITLEQAKKEANFQQASF